MSRNAIDKKGLFFLKENNGSHQLLDVIILS